MLWERYRLTLTIYWNLKLHKFPFDTQLLPIMIESCEYKLPQLILLMLRPCMLVSYGFYRATACNATHGIAVGILSVCLSVRPSDACIVTRLNNAL